MAGGITRRRVLTGGGAGVGLLVAWTLWPRRWGANVARAPGETVLGPFLRIGENGRVVVLVPQAETGQGIWTALAQVAADELGADWRTVAVEPAPASPATANLLLAGELAEHALPDAAAPILTGYARRRAHEEGFAVTALSTSLRGFERPMRTAAATARALLCMAAAERWGIDWRACDVEAGFVVRGRDRLRFAELAAEAAGFQPPEQPPLRSIGDGGLSGRAVPPLDAAAKLDGSTRFAGDVRLPGMVFAAVRQAPLGNSRLVHLDKVAVRDVPDLVAIVDTPGWVAAVADNWWAANRALDRLAPRFETRGGLPDDASIARALADALGPESPPASGEIRADYISGPVALAAIETPAATARLTGDRLEIWAATQAPGDARAAAASAIGWGEDRVALYPMPVGGGFGQGLDHAAVAQAARIAATVRRPVQLMWSRVEASLHDRFGPPARARLTATVASGRIASWRAEIASHDAVEATFAPMLPHVPTGGARPGPPPYAIPKVEVAHHAADLRLPTGVVRGEAGVAACFFAESFVDELAAQAGVDPLSFRIAMLGDEPRLADCLSRVAVMGEWQGGIAGVGQGLAVHAAYGSFAAVLAQVRVEGGAIVVERLTCAADCGRMVNPDLVRRQVAGGLLFALPHALGPGVTVTAGLPARRRIGEIGIPTVATAPELRVRLVPSLADPGGVSGLTVPPVAAALANALAALTGHRSRSLPLSLP
ncbi:molybdopterin cofactor-binding domain-containing protein [Sphingomonas sp.]|uniref:molybdopterin cofactor-binding domain-containing protein n=1 Tax=Sphingomonas sp. TaxID=28214 RepID=UPI003AFFD301